MDDRPTLVVVGAASRDIHADDPRGWRLGGTAPYASLVGARLGVRVRALVGVDEMAATASELEVLDDAGVEVELVPMDHGPVFDNQQTPAGRVQIVHSISDQIPASALPPAWRTPSAALLGPVAGELSDEWASAFPRQTYVAIAAQGLVRALVVGEPVETLPISSNALLSRADVIAISAEDVAGGAPPIQKLLPPRQEPVIPHNPQGALPLPLDGTSL
ncbi:MAG: hypothetical protein ACR2H0_02465, partial [Candidatus Limnocylindrales bacterium]